MRKNLLIFLSCIVVCLSAYRFGDVAWSGAKTMIIEKVYSGIGRMMCPLVHIYHKPMGYSVYEDIEMLLMPVLGSLEEDNLLAGGAGDDGKPENNGGLTGPGIGLNEPIDSEMSGTVSGDTGTEEPEDSEDSEDFEDSEVNGLPYNPDLFVGGFVGMSKLVEINRGKLQDFDYLRQNFYQVDSSTTIGSDLLNVESLLGKDITLAEGVEGPQILIYHTHSQEAFADSVQGDSSTSIMAVGAYLAQLLEEQYGIKVLHHKGTYDVGDHAASYSNAQPHIRKLLEENPSIELVIDMHRDGVPENRHLVTEINGKPTAQIMFFNGLSRTTSTGNLSYLSNPYIENNLAVSFQMQLAANEYFPGLTRKIYLKGYRYNMHLCPKSMLIEVGAQTNTFEEARNAMEPLALLLANVLKQ